MVTESVKYYQISEDAARQAKQANSFSDYQEGSATAAYRQMVNEAVELGEKQKKRVDPMYHEKIDALVDTYARKLAANLNQSYSIAGRCPSILISGGSNFPVRKKEKQNAAADRNMQEYMEIQGLLVKIRSVGMGGISSDDPQALQKLRTKLANLESAQQTMKDVNAYYRKNKTLDGCPHISPEQIENLKTDMASQWHLEDKPFASYSLTNNLANIKRIRERVAELEKRQTDPAPEGWSFEGGEVVMNTELNRLQIVLDDRPDDDLKEALKVNGFRWAPSQGAWQRQLTDNAVRAAKRITGGLMK